MRCPHGQLIIRYHLIDQHTEDESALLLHAYKYIRGKVKPAENNTERHLSSE
jgi:hypothetical protein